MGKVRCLGVMALVVACGGSHNAEECAPGDASRPDVICSPAGKWIARSDTSEAGTNDGQQASLGGSGSQVTSTGVGGSSAQAASAGAGGSGSGGSAGSGGSGGAGGSSAIGGSAGTSGSPGAGGSAEVSACLSTGTLNCSDQAPCCDGSMCVTAGSDIACAALCTGASQCSSGCCATVDANDSVCAPTSYCPAPPQTCTLDSDCSTGCCFDSLCEPAALCAPPPSVSCGSVALVANDGTYLGDATSFATTNSVCNQYGLYGSPYGVDSIYNPYGLYGSQFSIDSAYDPYTITPPVLYCTGSNTALNPVSKNQFVVGNGSPIDPDALCAVLAANGL